MTRVRKFAVLAVLAIALGLSLVIAAQQTRLAAPVNTSGIAANVTNDVLRRTGTASRRQTVRGIRRRIGSRCNSCRTEQRESRQRAHDVRVCSRRHCGVARSSASRVTRFREPRGSASSARTGGPRTGTAELNRT